MQTDPDYFVVVEPTEGKLKSLTLEEKMKLIDLVESGRSVKDVAEEHGVNRNTLHYILKNRSKIRENISANPGISGFKRIKQTKSPELEKRILAFMEESRLKGEKLSGSIIKSVALEAASDLQVENFLASNGWLFSFFKRHRITISEYNKSINTSGDNSRGGNKSDDVVQFRTIPMIDEFHEENVIEENIQNTKTEAEVDETIMQVVEYEYEQQDDSQELEEEFQVEMVNEEQADETIYESDEPSWQSWCRLCGNCETLPELEVQHAEIVQQLLFLPLDIIKICGACDVALGDISRMIQKSRVVEAMLLDVEKRSRNENLSSEELGAIRSEFGFEGEAVDDREEFLNDDDTCEEIAHETDYEEQFYEDIECITEDIDLKNEFEVVEEFVDDSSVPELIDTQPTNKNSMQLDEALYDFKCHICYVTFERMCFLTSHTRNEHQCMPQVACTCGRLLSTWESLMMHKRKHEAIENGFICNICKATFRSKTGLSIHIKFKHERPTKQHLCSICDRTFKDSGTLKMHVRTHLPDEEKFSHECGICGKRVVNKWSLKYHINTIHEKAQHHFCHLCGRGFGNKSNLRSHVISHSTENVQCEICGGNFKNRISLQSHRKIHKPEHMRKFACDVCKKTFHNRNHLERHMISHSEIRSFKCHYPSCLNEYKWLKDLKNHMAGVHTGLRPHQCPFCEKTFVDTANARKHKVREHPVELKAFESQYGKGRKVNFNVPIKLEVSFTDEAE